MTVKALGNDVLLGLIAVIILAGCGTTLNLGRGSTRHLDDSVVTAGVKEALQKDPVLAKEGIEITTISGEVVLRGRVESIQDVYRAAEIVNKVDGVQSLLNLLSEK